MKIKHIMASVALPVVATFLFAQTALAATPSLSLAPSTGDSVQVTVQGDANSTVILFYNIGSASGTQSRPIGNTDSNGHFSLPISTGGFGITPNLSVYVLVSSQPSSNATWPAVGTGSTGNISLSQNNITLSPGQGTVITLTGGSNTFFITNNSNSNAVTFALSGTQLTATGVNSGTATATICDQANLSNCTSLNITTSGTSTSGNTGSIIFNPNNVSVNSGNGATIVLLSGGSNYTITTDTNSAALNASINGSSVNLSANTTGSATAAVTVCSGGTSSCGILNVSINGGIITSSSSGAAPTFSQTNVSMGPGTTQSISISGNGGYTISNNSNPSVVTPSINGSVLTLSTPAGTVGSSIITVCQQSGGCGTVTVSTNGTGVTGSSVFFSPSSPAISIGQTVTVTLTGGSGSYFLSANPSPNIAGTSLNGNTLAVSGIASGIDTITVCASSGGCGSLSATVGGGSTQSSGAVAFSQINPTLTVGQTLNIALSGGNGSYFLSSTANNVQASITGSSLTLTGLSAGSATLSVCSSSGGCSTLSIAVNAAAQSVPVTTPPPTTTTQTTTATTPLNSAALNSILAQIQQLTTLLLQLENQAIAQLQQIGGSTTISSSGGSSGSRTFIENLSLGSTGSEVSALQQRLTSEGVYSGPINGSYGAATEKAVKAYQSSHGISPIGIVGPATRSALNGS